MSRQSAGPRDVKVAKRQGLREGILRQPRRGPFYALPVAGFEAGLDRIAREQQVIVAHSPRLKQRFALRQGCLARGRVFAREGERAQRKWAEERGPGLAADLYRLFRVGQCFRPPRNEGHTDRNEPPVEILVQRFPGARNPIDALPDAPGPMTTKELARHVMAERGLNTADTALLQLFTRRTGALLRWQKKRGILRSVKDPQHGRFDLWEIAV